jgi:hypothetical protein
MLRELKTIKALAAVLSGFVVLVFWAGLAQSTGEQSVEKKEAVPIVEVKTPTYDFDQVSQGDVVKHEFQVFNKGSAPLEIENVKPD